MESDPAGVLAAKLTSLLVWFFSADIQTIIHRKSKIHHEQERLLLWVLWAVQQQSHYNTLRSHCDLAFLVENLFARPLLSLAIDMFAQSRRWQVHAQIVEQTDISRGHAGSMICCWDTVKFDGWISNWGQKNQKRWGQYSGERLRLCIHTCVHSAWPRLTHSSLPNAFIPVTFCCFPLLIFGLLNASSLLILVLPTSPLL